MILQLNPPIPLNTPRGEGLAHLVTDYGPEHDLMWTVFINETGECWTYSNREVRAVKNITMGRTLEKEKISSISVSVGSCINESSGPFVLSSTTRKPNP